MRRLTDDLGPDEGVFIYPEGTRFTPERQRRALDRIRRHGDADLVARAERLRHVLPPRLGGTMALLERRPARTRSSASTVGFDGIRSFHDFLGGGLIDRTIEVEFWRVPAAHIPEDRDAQIDWLYDHWSRVDEWVGHRSGAAAGSRAVPGRFSDLSCTGPMRSRRPSSAIHSRALPYLCSAAEFLQQDLLLELLDPLDPFGAGGKRRGPHSHFPRARARPRAAALDAAAAPPARAAAPERIDWC